MRSDSIVIIHSPFAIRNSSIMFSSLLAVIFPTFGIIAIGWYCRVRGIFTHEAIRGLSGYAYLIALPALIFESVFGVAVRGGFTAMDFRYLLGLAVGHALIFVIAALVLVRARRELRTFGPVLLALGATAYLGIPFATFAFGEQGTAIASLGSVTVFVSMLLASLVLLNRSGQREHRTTLHELLHLPFLWMVLLGLLLPFVGVYELPVFLVRTISILSASAGPTALLALGAFQHDLKLARVPWRWAIPLGIGKVLLPAIASIAALMLLGVTGLPLAVGAVLSCTSVAVTAFVLSDEYHLARELTAGTIIISTITSLIALSTIAWLWIGTGVFTR